MPKMQSGAKAVFVVPHQKPNEAYDENDRNQHLYTWNPMTLGNLFKAGGYNIVKVDVIRHAWMPKFLRFNRLGPSGFDIASVLYSYYKGIYQIRVVAAKP
ncbi:MAG: hypothetical protein K8F30_05035, partial [Taibaiella sp.]|nr:hypothetical protein [Taibaiella sp.]